jgi:hypothetical protein
MDTDFIIKTGGNAEGIDNDPIVITGGGGSSLDGMGRVIKW